jgi:hypothetical protein
MRLSEYRFTSQGRINSMGTAMKKDVLTRAWLSLALVAVLGPLTSAQPAPEGRATDRGATGRYVPFDIAPNYESLVKDRLRVEQQLGPLKDLIKQIAADPKRFPLDLKTMKGLKLEDPELKKAVQEWVARDPGLQQALHEWSKHIPPGKHHKEMRDLQKKLEAVLNPTPKGPASKEPGRADVPTPKTMEPIKPQDDPLARLTERAMQQAQETKLGDWLRDSPAWRRALNDLQESLKNPPSDAANAHQWGDFAVPDQKIWTLGEGMLERLRNLPRPRIADWNENLRLPPLGDLPLPNLHGHFMPNVSAPSLPTIGVGVTWFLFVLLFMLVSWSLLSWAGRSKKGADDRAALGPWPIRPEEVATRTELVRAFDYLALWSLGLRAKSWNHQAIARHWSERSPACGDFASALAIQYEQARYTDGAEELPVLERDLVRKSLLALKGAF